MSRLSKNITYNLGGQLALLALGFVAVRFLFRSLGGDAVGLIYFALTLNAFLVAVLDAGITATTVREVATAGREGPRVQGLIRTASLAYWASYVILALATFLLAPVVLAKWTHIETLNFDTAVEATRLLGLGALLALPRSLYASLFRGLQRMEVPNLVDVGASLFQQAGTIAILGLGGGLVDVSAWLAFGFLIAVVAYFFLAARNFGLGSLLPGFSAAAVKDSLGFSSQMMGISTMSAIHTQIDRILVSKLLPISTFGYYAFAAGAVSRSGIVAQAVSQAAFPSLSAEPNPIERLRQYRKLQDLLVFGPPFYLGAIAFLALPFFTYTFNAQVARGLLLPVVLLCIGQYLNATLQVPYVFSLAAGRPDITLRMNVLALFITTPLALVLTLWLGLGGAALSWIAYQLWACVYSVPRICEECLLLPAMSWYRNTGKAVGLVATTYGVIWILELLSGTRRPEFWIIGYLLSTVAFSAGAYILVGSELRGVLFRLRRSILVRP